MSLTPPGTKNLIKRFEQVSIKDSRPPERNGDAQRKSYVPPILGQTKMSQENEAHGTDQKTPTTTAVRRRKILIVFAHWERSSFNGALLDTAVTALTEQGHEITVSDLYAQKFNPVLSRNDIQDGPRDAENFNYATEAGLAYVRGTLAPDVVSEQAKLAEADLVIFQFPLAWCSVPAILKGYFDRVLVQKFSYEFGKWFDKGHMREKRAILSITTGSMESSYSAESFMGDINVILWPLQNGVLRFCGFDILSPNICFSPGYVPPATRQSMLDAWRERLSTDLWQEKPLHFLPIDSFDPATGSLKPEVLRRAAGDDEGSGSAAAVQLPIGQHAGLKVAPSSMYRSRKTSEVRKANV